MKRPCARLLATAFLGAALLAGGCSILRPRPDPSRFFVLATLSESGEAVEAEGAVASRSIGIGPIRLPDYVKRPELVVRTGATQIEPSRIDRWAEPLDKAVPRVIANNLATLLATDRIVTYPWLGRARPDYQVEVEVLRFEPDDGGQASLEARWEVRDIGRSSRPLRREASIVRRATGKDTASIVSALSAALSELSREIASSVRNLPAPQGAS